MRKLVGVIYNTWYGAFLGWGASGLLALHLVYEFGPYQSLGWLVKAIVFVHGSLGVVVASAVIYSLVKGHLLRALCQFVLAIVSALLFAAGFIAVAFAIEANGIVVTQLSNPSSGTRNLSARVIATAL